MNEFNKAANMAFIIVMIFYAGCNFPASSAEREADLNVTQAYQTVEARLTQGAVKTPLTTQTFTPTSAASATPTIPAATAMATSSPVPTTAESSPVAECDLAAAGNPIDVTIPDDTQLQPGEAFSKVWRLQNAGTCTWDKNYSIALFSGDGMGASSNTPLEKQVLPDETIDISVDMIAPESPGTYQGNWKLQNGNGDWFGIGPSGGSAFWVRILVGDGTTLTPSGTEITPTLTTEPETTGTAAPGGSVSGVIGLAPGDGLDLDSKDVNSGGADFLFTEEEDGQLYIGPNQSAKFEPLGFGPPTQEECKSMSLSGSSYKLANISEGTFFCYQTNDNRYGWLQAIGYSQEDGELTVQMLTWTSP